MDNLSHGFMRKIRDAAKATDPNALVLGEKWDDASAYLLGDQADSVMNYRFRRAVIGLVNGDTGDLDGAIDGLTPSQFVETMRSVQEDYPAAAFDALLNLVDSHDTTRILWTLTPGADNPAEKEDPANLAVGKAKLRQVAALQMTWPGMASIYYGTEAGLTGQDDPDDRRTYPWDSIDTGLRDWYAKLGQLRQGAEALKSGDLTFLPADDTTGIVSYVRRSPSQAAVVVLNTSDKAQEAALVLNGVLPSGTVLKDALGDVTVTIGEEPSMIDVPARGSLVLLTGEGLDLEGPAAAGEVSALAGPGVVNLSWAAGRRRRRLRDLAVDPSGRRVRAGGQGCGDHLQRQRCAQRHPLLLRGADRGRLRKPGRSVARGVGRPRAGAVQRTAERGCLGHAGSLRHARRSHPGGGHGHRHRRARGDGRHSGPGGDRQRRWRPRLHLRLVRGRLRLGSRRRRRVRGHCGARGGGPVQRRPARLHRRWRDLAVRRPEGHRHSRRCGVGAPPGLGAHADRRARRRHAGPAGALGPRGPDGHRRLDHLGLGRGHGTRTCSATRSCVAHPKVAPWSGSGPRWTRRSPTTPWLQATNTCSPYGRSTPASTARTFPARLPAAPRPGPWT